MTDDDTRSFLRRVGIVLALGVLTLALLTLAWRAAEVLLLLFAGVLVALILHVPTAFLERRTRLPAGLSLGLVLVGFLAVIGGIVTLFGAQLAAVLADLAQQIPDAFAELRDRLDEQPWGQWVLDRMPEGGGGAGGANLMSGLAGTATTVWDVTAKFVFVFFTGVFLAASPGMYRDGLLRLVPPGQRERARTVVDELGRTLRGWILGQLVAMVIVGLLVGIGLWIVGVPAAWGLALIAGLLEFIPFIGPFLAFLPAALLALSQGATPAIATVVLYVVVQQLEGNVITPLVQRRTVQLPPALTIAAVFVAGALFGAVGLLVATPLVAVILVLVKMLYLHDVLGETVEVPGKQEKG